MKKVFIVAGETSGDAHAAKLCESLAKITGKNLSLSGWGGSRMRALENCTENLISDWLEEASVLGLWEVAGKYRFFENMMAKMRRQVADIRPEAVILTDYPGFNLRLAQNLRRDGFVRKIIFFISPQIWAWRQGRAREMADYLDMVLCFFPFEAEFYKRHGLAAEFVGHPFCEEFEKLPEVKRERNLLGFFPGSRVNEARKILPAMLECANLLWEHDAKLRFIISAANPKIAEIIKKMLHKSDKFEIALGRSRQLMQRAWAGAVTSGTATLEAAFAGMPYSLCYRVSPLTYWAGKFLIRTPFLGIVNNILRESVVEEFVQYDLSGRTLADSIERLTHDEKRREKMLENFTKAKQMLAGDGFAYANAANAIVNIL